MMRRPTLAAMAVAAVAVHSASALTVNIKPGTTECFVLDIQKVSMAGRAALTSAREIGRQGAGAARRRCRRRRGRSRYLIPTFCDFLSTEPSYIAS